MGVPLSSCKMGLVTVPHFRRGSRPPSLSPVLARFDSKCGICLDTIFEGDPMVKVEEEWVHEDCGRDHLEE